MFVFRWMVIKWKCSDSVFNFSSSHSFPRHIFLTHPYTVRSGCWYNCNESSIWNTTKGCRYGIPFCSFEGNYSSDILLDAQVCMYNIFSLTRILQNFFSACIQSRLFFAQDLNKRCKFTRSNSMQIRTLHTVTTVTKSGFVLSCPSCSLHGCYY